VRRVLVALVCGVAGYLIGAFGGGYLITALTSNTHDASVEGAMTGAFVTGPVLGLVALLVGFFRRRPKS
jgi:hypothetical protein